MSAVATPCDRIVGLLETLGCNPRPNGSGWTARCPAHDDRNPSLSIREADDGTVLVKCFAGCALDSVLEKVGLRSRDLFPGDNVESNGESDGDPTSGLTLAEYAKAKGLPERFLSELGLTQISINGRPVVRIPYRYASGSLVATRFRTALMTAR